MTVRRSAGVEVVKGSVRSAWYAELNFISAFGVEVALADEAECIGVKGRKCENGLQFRIRRRGASRGYSLPACVSTAPSGNRKGVKNRLIFNRRARPNCMSIDYNLVQACDPALAHFTQKTLKKVYSNRLFALPECLPSETQKGGHEAAFAMVSRQGEASDGTVGSAR